MVKAQALWQAPLRGDRWFFVFLMQTGNSFFAFALMKEAFAPL